MQFIYIHDPNSERQRKEIKNIKTKYPSLVILDVNEVKQVIPIRATPTIVILREDMQGEEQLLELDEVAKKYKFEGLLAEEAQKEEREFYGQDSEKLLKVIERRVEDEKIELMIDMLGRGVL